MILRGLRFTKRFDYLLYHYYGKPNNQFYHSLLYTICFGAVLLGPPPLLKPSPLCALNTELEPGGDYLT